MTATITREQSCRWGAGFLGLTALILSGTISILISDAYADSSTVLGTAIAADLALVLPLSYYLLMVRGAGLPAFSVLPVTLLSILVVMLVLPTGHAAATTLSLLVLPAEIALATIVVYKVRQFARVYVRSSAARPFDEVLPRAAAAVLGGGRVADVVVGEILVLYYAVSFWRRKPHRPEGAQLYTSHRDSGWGGVFLGMILVVAVEVLVVHLLVSEWNDAVAWTLTGLGLYGLLWLVADYRAMYLRPTVLTEEHLQLRIGLRWSATIPLRVIRTIRPYAPDAADSEVLRLTVLGQPNLVLELAEPVEVRGLLGWRRRASVLSVAMDGHSFAGALEQQVTERQLSPIGRAGLGRGQAAEDIASATLASLPPLRDIWLWLTEPIRHSPRSWLAVNGLVLGTIMVAALSYAVVPGLGDRVIGQLLATGVGKVVAEGMGGGRAALFLPLLVFVNNFAVIMLLVVGASILLPYAGVVMGALLAIPLGLGLGLAITSSAYSGLLAIAPVLLLEQQAVAMGMFVAVRLGRRLQGRRDQTERSSADSKRAAEIWRGAAAIAAFLMIAAVYESILLLVFT